MTEKWKKFEIIFCVLFSGKAIPLSKAGIYVAPATAATIDNKNTSDQEKDPLLGLLKDTEPLPTALAQRSRGAPQECFIETPCTRPCGDGFKLLLPNPKGKPNYSLLLICNRAVTNRHVLDIPSVLVHLDRVFSKVSIAATIRTVFFH